MQLVILEVLLFLTIAAIAMATYVGRYLHHSFGITGTIAGILTFSVVAVGIIRFQYRRKARKTTLKALRVLTPEQREKLLQKFSTKERARLVHELEKAPTPSASAATKSTTTDAPPSL